MDYEHTQREPLMYIIYGAPTALWLYMAWAFRDAPLIVVISIVAGIVFMLTGLCFCTLTVRDEGHHLAVRFGPLAVFTKMIDYSEITFVEPDQAKTIDGFGVRWVPTRGWSYNLWGSTCVKLQVGGTTIRVGTDDVENLVAFLRRRVGLQ